MILHHPTIILVRRAGVLNFKSTLVLKFRGPSGHLWGPRRPTQGTTILLPSYCHPVQCAHNGTILLPSYCPRGRAVKKKNCRPACSQENATRMIAQIQDDHLKFRMIFCHHPSDFRDQDDHPSALGRSLDACRKNLQMLASRHFVIC